jgi:hypothetical protein
MFVIRDVGRCSCMCMCIHVFFVCICSVYGYELSCLMDESGSISLCSHVIYITYMYMCDQ